MLKMFHEILLVIFCISVSFSSKVSFDQYHVYTLHVESAIQAKLLQTIESNGSGYDFWKSPVLGDWADVMVAPHKLADFEEIIQSANISYQLMINNVQRLIDEENPIARPKTLTWNGYYGLDEIYAWIDEKLAQYPGILTHHIVGKSYQGRDIRAVLLSHKPDNPLIFIESNIHAREWITSATATSLLNELLTSQNPDIRDLAENFNWLIVPVFNVDGFVYTHKTNRMWRKTRQPHTLLCTGTDPNRNFDFKWMEIGASSNPCSETYAGPKPFSESETQQLAEFVQKHRKNMKVYFAIHSYGQYFMFPYGHTGEPVGNYDPLMKMAKKTVDAIAVRYGTDYLYGPSSTTIYETSGSSVDWFYEKVGIKVGYTFEFRDRRGGFYGFLLPASQIIPNCLEIMDGLIAFIKEARELQQV